jgi:hypothetical protein
MPHLGGEVVTTLTEIIGFLIEALIESLTEE